MYKKIQKQKGKKLIRYFTLSLNASIFASSTLSALCFCRFCSAIFAFLIHEKNKTNEEQIITSYLIDGAMGSSGGGQVWKLL